jgi:deoxyribonuclease-4
MRTGGKGVVQAARLAVEIGCETIQVFAANPSAWRTRPIDPLTAAEFRRLLAENGIHPVAVHTPYLLNLATSDPVIHDKSAKALADSLERARMLGAHYVVTHIGSHLGMGVEQGIAQICKAATFAMQQVHGTVMLLLENSAGTGRHVGSTFENLSAILDRLPDYGGRLGICLDTAHVWAAGYDVSEPEGLDRTLKAFDGAVGLERLKFLHFNDSKVPLGSHIDRHANIGQGNIGESGFSALINHPALDNLAGVIETPGHTLEQDLVDMGALKRLRTGRP